MKTTLLRSALLASTISSAIPALAQDPSQNDNESNSIIVTAQKVEQRAQDVPITISAVTGERIEDLAINNLDQLSRYVPGLNIQEQSANNPGVVIRGITSDSGSSQQGPRVTLYYNGVDISRSRGSYQAIYDLERVEVIKGPQATLFGTASAVGAISLISARPRPGFSGELAGGYGNFDQKTLAGHINAGSDILAGRIAFEWRNSDGYVNNLATSQSEDLYSKDQLGLRASLRITPSSDLTIDLIGTYDQQRNGGTPFISGIFPAFSGAPGGAENAFEDANLGGSPFSAQTLGNSELGLNREVYDLNLTAEYEFADDWAFTTVNGFREFDSREVFDADGSAASFLEFAEIADGWQISHEGRFTYSGSSLRSNVGWNLFIEDGRQNVPFSTEEGVFLQCITTLIGSPQIPNLPCVAPDGSVPATAVTGIATMGAVQAIPYAASFENQGRNESYSVFADVTWIATDRIELTAGVRYINESRESGFLSVSPASSLSGAPLIPAFLDTNGETYNAKDNFDSLLPRFNALYRISNDVNVFATISKGRRSPVVQLNATTDAADNVVPNLQIVPEETVWNYEGGLKIASGPVTGSLGVYYQVYDGFQVTTLDSNGQSRTESAGKASNFGVEAELTVEATDWLQIFGNIGYIDGGIDRNNDFAPQYSGARFRLQPEWQAASGFTINAPISDGVRFFATPSVNYRSRIFFEVPNDPLISQDAVTLANIRAGISFADDRYEIAGFVRNAFDEDYLLDAGNTGGAFGNPTFIPAEPRFYGLQLTARFGD